MAPDDYDAPRVSTGTAGLDDILGGGFDRHRVYLLEGRPGTGKTTIALQFLREGVRRGEKALYVTLSESESELRLVARRHGWSLDQIAIFELAGSDFAMNPARELTLLHPAELELNETASAIVERVRQEVPSRIAFDSLSELRLLAQNPLRYRRQVLALKQFFTSCQCTVLLLDDLTSSVDDQHLHSIAHGVITLEQLAVDYGAHRRRLRVAKMRGIDFRGGYHDFEIRTGGAAVYPRLVAAEHHRDYHQRLAQSGDPALDALLGGGLEHGSSTLLLGPAGVGKSSIATAYAMAAAEQGERAAIFAFDEGLGTFFARADGMGMALRSHVQTGRIRLQQIDPAELAPGAFAHLVRDFAESSGARVVVIDSLNGYLNAMPDERFLVLQMHELLSMLNQLGIVTILVLAQHGIMGPMQTPMDISYLSDTVLLLRYFEANGRVRRALSVVKKRSGVHEHTIREFQFSATGLKVGPALNTFSGVLSGAPVYTGPEELLEPPE